jgi:hypothetical protein
MIDALERYVKLAAPTMSPEAGIQTVPDQDEVGEPADESRPPAGGDTP